MEETAIAKLFKNGRSQAVRLPKEFRFEGDKVRLRRVGKGVMIEPLRIDTKEWFRKLDKLITPDFMADGRDQPPPQERDFFD
jgi:antitoxin VapB